MRSELTQQSVHRLLDQLSERGIIGLGEPKPGLGKGQPSPMLSLNGAYAHSIGISVNTDIMGICLMDLAGTVLGQGTVSLHGQPVAEALQQAGEVIAGLRNASSLDPARCFGFGFAIAGYFVGGTRYNASLPLHDWSLIELGPLLSEAFRGPVWVHNGGSTGAVAEALFGVGRHIPHFAYLSFNYGFGGGIVSDGDLLVGGNGNAGEWGPIFKNKVPRPALELLIERLRANGITINSITHLQRQFDPNWPAVADWVDEVAPYYNRLVDSIIGVFDPQAIVFGGQVPPALAEMFIARTDPPEPARYGVPRPAVKLIVSEIKGDASALGAAAVPLKAEFF
ncbi:NagC family transcriptional regulator [Mesorhizobium sp. L-8-3]|nr:NagC family transcriptional regulator [Mesorhizobium sp. L-8-3]